VIFKFESRPAKPDGSFFDAANVCRCPLEELDNHENKSTGCQGELLFH
jgi:hypothetical protein